MQTSPTETIFEIDDLIRLRTLYRRFGSDEGPSLEVYVRPRGGSDWRRAARYDCFRDEPHRHVFGTDGSDDRQEWGAAGQESALVATAEELERGLPAIIEKAGYPEIAAGLAPDQYKLAVTEAVADLRKRMAGGSSVPGRV